MAWEHAELVAFPLLFTNVRVPMGNCCSSWPRRQLKAGPLVNDGNMKKRSHVVPSTARYLSKTGKSVVEILKAAAPLVPVPLVGQVLDVVLTLINICEQATALQGQIDDLKDQLCSLAVILVDSFVESEGLPPATKTRILKLRDELDRTASDLQEILNQGSAALGFFQDINKGSVDGCVTRLNVALREFHLSHAITTEQDLHRVLQRLEDISSQLRQANRGIEEIKNLIENSQLHNAIVFSSGMPAPLPHFRGRPGMITDIGNLLCSDNPTKRHIAILATGGMGKTTVAVQVMENDAVKRKYDDMYRFWVSCKGATSFPIFLQVLATSLRVRTNSGDLRTDIRSELTASNTPRLIALDNFETPWETSGSEKESVESVLCSLAAIPHVSIVITMRSNFSPSSQTINWHQEFLLPLDLESSRQIYTDIDPSAAGHEDLDELLTTLGYMPYAITLVATLGKRSGSQPNALLKLWKDGGTGILGNEGIERSISLSVDSKSMQLHPEAMSLLIILSMLPAGATRDHIDWWADRIGFKIPLAISTLNEAALVSKLEGPSDTPTYFVYPVVQSYMEHSGRISAQDRINLQEAAFKFILAHKSFPSDPKFKDDLNALATEDVNLQGILTSAARQRTENCGQLDVLDTHLLDSLLTFSLYQLRTKPTLNIVFLAVDVARRMDNKHGLAEALNCLGQIRHHLDDHDGACEVLKEARILFDSLSNRSRSAETTYFLWLSYAFSENIPAQCALADEARAAVTTSITKDDRKLRAIALLVVGYNLLWLQNDESDLEAALTYLSSSREEFEGTGHSFERAQCFSALSHCYSALENYPESMKAAQLAAEELEYLGLDVARNYVRISEGFCLLKLELYDEALHVSETCLQESRRLGDVLSTADALELIAQVFEQKGDTAVVQLAYESALQQYQLIEHAVVGRRGIEHCEQKLNVLAQAVEHDKHGESDDVDEPEVDK